MKIIKRFEKAVRADEMKGCRDPEFFEEIKKEYRDSKKALREYIKELKEVKKDDLLS